MLVCVIMGSAIPLLGEYVKSDVLCKALRFICAVIIAITVIGRLISGVHWFTDILGGILVSVMLLNLYAAILERIENNND